MTGFLNLEALKLTKRCRSCRQELPIREFYRKRGRPDGLQQECIECGLDRARERYWRKRRIR